MKTGNGLSACELAGKVDGLRHRQELEEAKRVAFEGLETFPDAPGLHIALGRVWLLDHKPRLALGSFTAAAVSAPDIDMPVAWQIAALSRQRQYPEAISLGTAALGPGRFPDSVPIRVALGRVFLDSSQPSLAEKHLEDAARMAPGDDEAVSWWCACLAALFRWDAAEKEAEAAIGRYQGDTGKIVQMRYRLGRIHLDNHRLEQAIACFDAVLKDVPEHLRAMEWRITALRATGRPEDLKMARESAEAAVERYGNSAWLHAELAWVYCDEHKFEPARAAVRRAVRLAPGSPWARRAHIDILRLKRDYAAALNAVQAVPGELCDDPRILIATAALYADQGDYVNALATVNQALEKDQHNGEALRCRVDYLRHDYRLEKAADAAAAAIDRRDYDPDMYVTAAWVAVNQGNYIEALKLANTALSKDQYNAWALCSKIDFHRFAHEFDEAGRALDFAKEFRGDNPDVHVAAAWLSSAQGRPDEAAEQVVKALDLYPGHRAALAARIYFLRWSRQLEDAEEAAEKAVSLRKNDPDIQVAAGWLYSDLGNNLSALACADSAIDSAPYNSWVASCRVNFLRAAGEYKEAEKSALGALRVHPDDPYILIALGRLYGSRGQFDKALEQFGRSLKRNKWHLEALKWQVATLRGMLDFESAKAAAHLAIELREGDLSLHVELGRVYFGMRRFDDAIEEYDLVLDKVPGEVAAVIGKSAALRASRRAEEAERQVTAVRRTLPWNRDLLAELGWTRFDQRDWRRARADFKELLRSASNPRERAAARYGLGWVAYAAGKYPDATSEFCEAVREWPHAGTYKLGKAWSLAAGIKQRPRDGRPGASEADPWQEPEDLAYEVAAARQDPFAHACLGLIAFGRGRVGTAEYHLKKALDLDKYHPRHTDLGALYAWAARYPEAEEQLRKAIDHDWYDAAAHVELGHVYLRRGGDVLPDAQHEFRQALAANPQPPVAVRAVLGLAAALSLSNGDADAESALRDALKEEDTTDWRVHTELARVLIHRAENQQNEDLLDDAYQAAREAIRAAEGEVEPHLVAGLVQYCMAANARESTTRWTCMWQARKHLDKCLERDPGNSTAKRYLSHIKRQRRRVEAGLFGRAGLAVISLLLLAGLWVPYAIKADSQVITGPLLEESTPILLAMLTLAALLPVLVRLKVAGFEANLEHQPEQELTGPSLDDFSSRARHAVPGGPAGEDFFNPGRFTVLGERSDLPGWGPAWPRLPESAKDPSI